MQTLTCILKFKDGAEVRAVVQAQHRRDQNPVVYSGAVERLNRKPDRTWPSMLRAYFQDWAVEHDAVFTEQIEGTYDHA